MKPQINNGISELEQKRAQTNRRNQTAITIQHTFNGDRGMKIGQPSLNHSFQTSVLIINI